MAEKEDCTLLFLSASRPLKRFWVRAKRPGLGAPELTAHAVNGFTNHHNFQVTNASPPQRPASAPNGMGQTVSRQAMPEMLRRHSNTADFMMPQPRIGNPPTLFGSPFAMVVAGISVEC